MSHKYYVIEKPLVKPRAFLIYFFRCVHPAQQHGRRFPFAKSSHVLVILLLRVSGFFADIIQQRNSFLPRVVRLFHRSAVFADMVIRVYTSFGTRCTAPCSSFIW